MNGTTAVKGFVAGFLSVVTVMTAAWWLTRAAGFIPPSAPQFWSMTPAIPPFGMPHYVNLAFWGGVWGLVFNLIFHRLSGAGYWLAWILAGAIAVAGTAIFVVPMIKGLPIGNPPLQRYIVSSFLNGMFGLGAAIWLTLVGGSTR
jgi:hypothetical protein